MCMNFDWDENKNVINIQKHGLDFNDAIDIFNHVMLSKEDTSQKYGEARWISIGWIKILVGVVIYTEQVGDTIRIISARKATKKEVRKYENSLEY